MLASLILLMYSLTGIALICKGYQADLFDKICLLLLSLLLLWNSAAFQENRTRNYWWKEFKKEIEKLKAEHINQ
jgi:hypothetical protein